MDFEKKIDEVIDDIELLEERDLGELIKRQKTLNRKIARLFYDLQDELERCNKKIANLEEENKDLLQKVSVLETVYFSTEKENEKLKEKLASYENKGGTNNVCKRHRKTCTKNRTTRI